MNPDGNLRSLAAPTPVSRSLIQLAALLTAVVLLATLATPADAATILGPEDFTASVPPAGWSQEDVGGTGNLWAQDSSRPSPASGGDAAFYTDFNGANDVWLITSSMNFTGITAPELEYYENVNFSFAGDTHEVLFSTDYSGSGDPNLATWTTLNSAIGAEDTWVLQNFSLAAAAGAASVYVAFRYAGDFADEWWIDDVHVFEPDPFDVSVAEQSGDSDQAIGTTVGYTFRVTNNGTSADTYDLVGGGTYFDSLSTSTTAMLAAGAFEDVTVFADVPCGATLGVPEALSLTATSQGMGSVMDTDSLDVTPVDTNAGSGGGYFFANSLSTCAPSAPTFSWIDISGTGTDVIGFLTDDNFIGPFPIGFSFTYFGNTYTDFYIASNGWISFDGTDPGAVENRTNEALPDPSIPDDTIAVFWDDMNPADPDPGGTHVYYGNGPGGELVVTFERLPEFGADADGWITTQVILYASGNIRIQNMDNGPSIDLTGATVGIEDSAGIMGLTYHHNGTGGVLFSSPLAIEFGTDENDLPVELESFSIE